MLHVVDERSWWLGKCNKYTFHIERTIIDSFIAIISPSTYEHVLYSAMFRVNGVAVVASGRSARVGLLSAAQNSQLHLS